jgi:hypothetical protein
VRVISMRRLLALALVAVVVAGCGSSSGPTGHGSGAYPAAGEIWVGTSLASFTGDTGPRLTLRSDRISAASGTIVLIARLATAPKSTSDLQIDGISTYTIVLHTYATPDGEWWFWTSLTADASGFGLHGGEQPKLGLHTVELVTGYPTSVVVASGSFTLIP